jgi:hypothetical protein
MKKYWMETDVENKWSKIYVLFQKNIKEYKFIIFITFGLHLEIANHY